MKEIYTIVRHERANIDDNLKHLIPKLGFKKKF